MGLQFYLFLFNLRRQDYHDSAYVLHIVLFVMSIHLDFKWLYSLYSYVAVIKRKQLLQSIVDLDYPNFTFPGSQFSYAVLIILHLMINLTSLTNNGLCVVLYL